MTGEITEEGTHIQFRSLGIPPRLKMERWAVENKDGTPLGEIAWFSRWRKYAFFPYPGTVYEGTCMREITLFIEKNTAMHRSRIEK